MSRRTFLENMRQEARSWDASDGDSPRLSSDRERNKPRRTSINRSDCVEVTQERFVPYTSNSSTVGGSTMNNNTTSVPYNTTSTYASHTRVTPLNLAGAATAYNNGTANTQEAPLPDDALLRTHTTEFTTVSATTVALSHTSSPPPQTPATVMDADGAAHPPLMLDGEKTTAASAPSLPRRVNAYTGPVLSSETLEMMQQQQQQDVERPFSAESPGSWRSPRHRADRAEVDRGQANPLQAPSSTHYTGYSFPAQPHRRSSQSVPAVPDVLTTPRSHTRRRSSAARGSGATNGSGSRAAGAGTPTAVQRTPRPLSSGEGGGQKPSSHFHHPNATPNRAGSPSSRSRERSDSVHRMEASLIALQVELATEKRNNIEAEHHIMTLNTEVQRLRLDNARLSREVADAVTTAVSNAMTPVKAAVPSTVAAAREENAMATARIEALEARLGELSRNLETKQRELDTKDERIRLLEHKLADQLLLQTGVHYLAMPGPLPTSVHPASSMSTPLPVQQHMYLPASHSPYVASQQRSGNASLSGHSLISSAHAAAMPSRRLWQAADAPDTTVAGPRLSAVRHVTLGGVTQINEDSTSTRTSSAVRRRSPAGGHAGGPADDLRHLSPVPRSTGGEASRFSAEGSSVSRTRTPPPFSPSAPPSGTSVGPISSNSPALVAAADTTPAEAAVRRETPVRRSSARRPLPVRQPSARRGSARRPPSVSSRGSSSHTPANTAAAAAAASSAMSGRRVSKADTARRRADSTAASSDAGTAAAAAASSARVQRGSVGGVSLGRSAPSPIARRPSTPRRTSAASAAAAVGTPRTTAAVRRDSGSVRSATQPSPSMASSVHHPHPMHVNVSGNGGFGAAAAGTPTSHAGSSIYAMNQRALSTYRSGRQPSATRSVAQRSSTSTRSRPQIAFTTDGETSTMKGTTTTVMFRARDARVSSAGVVAAGEDSGNDSTSAPVTAPVAAAEAVSSAAEGVTIVYGVDPTANT